MEMTEKRFVEVQWTKTVSFSGEVEVPDTVKDDDVFDWLGDNDHVLYQAEHTASDQDEYIEVDDVYIDYQEED